MTTRWKTRGPRRAAALTLAGGLLALGIACETPLPTRVDAPAPIRAEAPSVDALAREPAFTPFTVAPNLLNVETAKTVLQESYPPLLREAGIGGRVLVYFFIDAEGGVRDVRINESSGQDALDQAALKVGRAMVFGPALNGDEPTPVWISLPITFGGR